MTIDSIEPGLRERKRLATHRSIQRAVLDLVAERGLERVTVDDISRRADVSPRTFFNYFTSKEAALVGDGPALPTEEAIYAFANAGPAADLLDGLRELLVEASELSMQDFELALQRRALLSQYPQLFAMRMASMHQFEDQLDSIIARRMAKDDPALARNNAALTEKSRLVTLVAMAALRHAWSTWAATDPTPLFPDRLRASFDALHNIVATGRP